MWCHIPKCSGGNRERDTHTHTCGNDDREYDDERDVTREFDGYK
jgi:hypothetical protein